MQRKNLGAIMRRVGPVPSRRKHSSSNAGAISAKGHAVSFSEGVRVRFHIHRKDMSTDEIHATWYSIRELKENLSRLPRNRRDSLSKDSRFTYSPGSAFCFTNMNDELFHLSPTSVKHVTTLQNRMENLAAALHGSRDDILPLPLPLTGGTSSSDHTGSPQQVAARKAIEEMNAAMLEAFPNSPAKHKKRRYLRVQRR